jgi:uracil-DNA glycosylase
MTDAPNALRSLLDWWGLAGVTSAEADLILAAPTHDPPLRQEAPPPPPKRKVSTPVAKTAAAGTGAEDARAAAAAATTLPELEEALARYEGCSLKRTAKSTVFMDGTAQAPVMLVGEAPGRDEDAAGKPFVGPSGRLLDKMLGAIGLSRTENVLITNVIFWRPPGNRPPTQGEIAACLPFVDRAIALARPKLLLLAGGSAAQTVLKRDDGVMRLRGKRLSCPLAGGPETVHAMVMLHPAYLLRRPQDKRLAWMDLLALADWADELGIERGKGL